MKYLYLILLSVMLTLVYCSKNQISEPPYNPEKNLEGTTPISDTLMRKMEGIYRLASGVDKLGSQFVCKVSKHKLSFFSERDGIFMILKYGLNPADSSIQFAGFWRYSRQATQGNIGFAVSKAEGAGDLLQNGVADNIHIIGKFLDTDLYTKDISFQFSRHFSAFTMTNDFAIFAHHGVQTTANPPYAENSIDGVLNDEDYGVTGVEFDVRMTKDGVPICIHDPGVNTRLTLKGPLTGNWDQYNWSVIDDFIRLKDGQKVPSVEQVCDAFVTQTNLKYLWLDIKGNTDIFKYMEPVVRNAYAKAAALNRDVVIFADIPTQAVIDEYKKQPSYATLPTMCELSLQEVIDLKCQYWGPRYSEGLLIEDVDKAHSLGIKVYSWTLNDPTIIHNYMKDGKFDGFITDYPAYVVYDYYTMF